jgi:phosphoribosylformylglycinamidine cyclo-ligase
VGYVIDRLPEAPPIFSLIQETGALPDIEMFATLNMGVGLCVIVPSSHRDRALAAGAAHGLSVLGYVTGEGKRMVRIVERGLVGTGDAFSLEAR